MKKRLSSVLLIIMLLINCLPFKGVAATGTPQYVLEDKTIRVGDTFKMDVAIDENPGIISLRFKVAYDTDVLELLSVENSGILNGFTTPAPIITSPYTLRWADSLATTDNAVQGTVITLTFKALHVTNTSSVTIEHGEARNAMGTKVEFNNATANVVVEDDSVGATGVILNKENISLKTGESETLNAVVSPNNATNKSVIWSSADNTIATVDNSGKVTAVKKGTTTITVTTEDGGFADSCEVQVACSHSNYSIHGEIPADCHNNGYTSGEYCNDCEIYFRGHEVILAGHKGGTADCKRQAVCNVCNESYGELDPYVHSNIVVLDSGAYEPTCGKDGLSVMHKCADCGTVLMPAEVIPATGQHSYGDWVVIFEPTTTEVGSKCKTCVTCGHKFFEEIPKIEDEVKVPDDDIVGDSEDINQDETQDNNKDENKDNKDENKDNSENPKTGDSAYIAFFAIVSLVTFVFLTFSKKRVKR